MGRGAADWRNKAIAPYKCAQQDFSPAPPMLHGSEAAITAVHCFQIVSSMPLQSGGMRFCLVAWSSIKRLAQAPLIFSC
jgi:hypothetical protein